MVQITVPSVFPYLLFIRFRETAPRRNFALCFPKPLSADGGLSLKKEFYSVLLFLFFAFFYAIDFGYFLG